MLKKNNLLVISLLYLLVIGATGLVSAYYMQQSLGAPVRVIGNEALSVSPENTKLFEFVNMCPGKAETTKVVVENKGTLPFALDLMLQVRDHSDAELLRSLNLLIVDSESGYHYYNGKLMDMDSESLGDIAPETEKELLFEVAFMSGEGIVTQSQSVDMQWTFTGSGALADTGDPGIGDPGEAADPGDPGDDTLFDPGDAPGDAAGDTAPAADAATADPADTDPDPAEADLAEVDPEDPLVVPLADAPVVTPVEDDPAPPALEVAPPEETIVVDPEAPEVALPEDVKAEEVNYWPLLLLLLIPLLLWLLWSSRVLVMVPDREGGYEVVARKIARPKEKKWHVNIQRQLDRYLAKHGYVIVDFRGRFLRNAGKVIYAKKVALGSGEMRYGLIGRKRLISWSDKLHKRSKREVG